jgi:hypothetical protein
MLFAGGCGTTGQFWLAKGAQDGAERRRRGFVGDPLTGRWRRVVADRGRSCVRALAAAAERGASALLLDGDA